MADWHDFIDGLKDGGSVLAKGELKNLVASAKADSNDFIRKQGTKLDRYLAELAAGEITPQQLEIYAQDLFMLTMMESAALAQEAQTRAHRLAMGIVTLVLKSLLALL